MSKGKTVTNTQTTIPEFQKKGFEFLINKGINLDNLPFNPYTGNPISDLTADQERAGATYRDLSNRFNNLDPLTRISTLGGQDIGVNNPYVYNPSTVSGNFDVSRIRDPREATGYSVLDRNINAYMNPYTDSVIDKGLSDINKYRQMQLQSDQDSAFGSNAYGGSRSGILEAMTNEAYQDKANEYVAQQREKAYRDATGLIDQDLLRFTTADATNIESDLERMGLDYDLLSDENKMALENAAIINEANRYGADARNTFDIANVDYDIANRQFDKDLYSGLLDEQVAMANRVGGFGSLQRGVDQAREDFRLSEFARKEQLPFDILTAQTGAITGIPAIKSTREDFKKKVGLLDGAMALFGFA